jgi:NAD-dependent dihydropyrimidine dehydrogenase PreA subunit
MDPEKPARRAWIHPSSLAFFRQGRKLPGYSIFDWLHGYVYARWPYLYIGIGVGEHRLSRPIARIIAAYSRITSRLGFNQPPAQTGESAPRPRSFAEGYHGKVVPLSAAGQLVTVDQPVELRHLEQIIPYSRATDIVLQNPDHLVALQCPCRSVRPNPCLPLDVCLIVGEPFASFVIEHHPGKARWLTRQQALDLLRAEDERGHVHHAFFKDAMLGRFYAICNCCACCCGAMQMQRQGAPMLVSSGYLCQVDEDLCQACGTCHDYCQFKALSAGVTATVVDQAACMGCGVCVGKCPQGALSLQLAPEKGEPLEIFGLVGQVAQASL